MLGGKRTIHFRNQITAKLTWAQSWNAIQLFEHLRDKSFTIKKTNNGYLIQKESNGTKFFSSSLETTRGIFELVSILIPQGWTFEQENAMTCRFSKNDTTYTIHELGNDQLSLKWSPQLEITGPYEAIWVYFFECLRGIYDYDYKNKIVLDVGGFCGESAVFFLSQGARKVIIYEPVPSHHQFIKTNVNRNNFNAEIHEEGIGNRDEDMTVNYDALSLNFGPISNGKGKDKLRMKIRNVTSVIEESNADIAKFDCEGAEISLITVPKKTLRKIEFYMIEAHNMEIRKAITDKFITSGFIQSRAPAEDISMLYFKKVP